MASKQTGLYEEYVPIGMLTRKQRNAEARKNGW